MPSQTATMHRPHRRLWRFLTVSALLHAGLLAPVFHPVHELRWPAPELVLTGLDASTRARPRPLAAIPAAPAIDRHDDTAADQAPASAPDHDPARANHLRSVLHVAFDRHFVYPPFARRNGWQGRVELVVRLDGDGRVDGVRLLHSSGHAILDQDAVLTVQRIGAVPEARVWLQGYSQDVTLAVLYRLTEG